MQTIKDNIMNVFRNIDDTCIKKGLDSGSITVMAVTKTVDPQRINYALECGIRDIGENKVQELTSKYDSIEKNVKWHLIGHLQTNKVKYIIDKVGLIHSVDSVSLAREIEVRAAKAGLIMDILIQVNVAGEETKFGIEFEEIDSFAEELSGFQNIRVKGLMTIAPYYTDPEQTRPIYKKLKEKYDVLKGTYIPNMEMKYLSMGMTNDYITAIEEGSNIVRIGTGIFGARNYNN